MTFKESEIELYVDVRKLGVVIPAFNAGKTIGDLIRELIIYGFRKDNIIVVDDGSKDNTNEIVTNFGLKVVNHRKNKGKGAALKDGFYTAKTKNLKEVFTLDADGQHKVSEIRRFIGLKGSYDLIIGVRDDLLRMPLLRRLVNRTTSLVVSLITKKYVPDVQCGFRYVNLEMFDIIKLKTNNYETESEMVIKAIRNKYRLGFVQITTVYNKEKSYIDPFVDTIRFIKMALESLWR